jgi:hypothetical protein
MQQQSKCFLCGPITAFIKPVIELLFSCLSLDSDFSFGIRIEEQPVLG